MRLRWKDDEPEKEKAEELRYGPVAWCTFCHRRHSRRKHDLTLVERIAKSGRTVYRWAHEEQE